MRAPWVAMTVVLAACSPAGAPDPPPAAVPTSGWQPASPVPTPRTEVGAAMMGGRIFVIGGFDGDGSTVSVVEAYNIATDRWSVRGSAPVAVNHPMAAATEDTIYLAGGFTAEGPPTDRAFAFRNGAWRELPRMPEPRAAGGAAIVDGLLYVVAGIGPAGHARTTLVFDPGPERWTTAAGAPVPRDHLGVAAAGGRVYAVGGRTEALVGNLGTSEAYDPASDAWTALPDLPTPRGGMAAAATSDGLVVAVGGEEEGGTFDEAEVFDPATGEWRALPPMPTARHGLGVVADGTVIYAVAGGPEPALSVSGAMESIDLG